MKEFQRIQECITTTFCDGKSGYCGSILLAIRMILYFLFIIDSLLQDFMYKYLWRFCFEESTFLRKV